MKTLNVDPKVSSTKVPEKIIALSPIKLNAKTLLVEVLIEISNK